MINEILKNRIKEYFLEYCKICQFKMLGVYEIYFINDKYYADDTRELIEKIYKIAENFTEEEVIEFIEEITEENI